MIRAAEIYNNGVLAGWLEKSVEATYVFTYAPEYVLASNQYAISLSLPKRLEPYYSSTLFPFFFGLLSEGVNKQAQCRLFKIDENDHFTLLLKTAQVDTIGAITVKAINS